MAFKTKTAAEKRDFREEVTNELIEIIEKEESPWQKPWDPSKAATILEMPHNGATGRAYRGANSLRLMVKAQKMGHGDDPRWVTYKQAKANGWQVRRGEKSTGVEYWFWDKEVEVKNPDTGETEKIRAKRDIPVAFYANVFHASQIDGIPAYEPKKGYEWEPVEAAEHILAASGAEIIHDQSDRAYRSRMFDNIHLPPKEAFPTAVEYYQTALHELGHWTGTEARLNRETLQRYHENTTFRAKEELRVEIASLYLAIETGVPFKPGMHGVRDISSTASYVQSWVGALKNDKNEIFKAAKDAELITDHLLNFIHEKTQIQEAVENNTVTLSDNQKFDELIKKYNEQHFAFTKEYHDAIEKNINKIQEFDVSFATQMLREGNNDAIISRVLETASPMSSSNYNIRKKYITTIIQEAEKNAFIGEYGRIGNVKPMDQLTFDEQVAMHSEGTCNMYHRDVNDGITTQNTFKNLVLAHTEAAKYYKELKEKNILIVNNYTTESRIRYHESQIEKYSIKEVVPVKEIWLYRAEGPINEATREITTNSFAKADEFLQEQAKTASNYGYDKTDFKVTWEDGSEYEGRYDLKLIDKYRSNMLEAQMKEEIEFLAGLYRPSHFKDETWKEHLSGLDPKAVEERKEWLKTGEGLGVQPPTFEKSTREIASEYIPTPNQDKTLSANESYQRHMDDFVAQHPGIMNAINRDDFTPLDRSIAMAMLEEGRDPVEIHRSIMENCPDLPEREHGYDVVSKAYRVKTEQSYQEYLQKAIEAEYQPHFQPAEETRAKVEQTQRYFPNDTPAKYEFSRQISMIHEKYNWEGINIYITPEIDTKIVNNMIKEGFTYEEAAQGLNENRRDNETYTKELVGTIQTKDLYSQGKSDFEVTKELISTNIYAKKDISELLTQHSSTLPPRSDERRKKFESIYRKAQKEIKLSNPQKAKGIAI